MNALELVAKSVAKPFIRNQRRAFYGLDDVAGMFSLGGLSGMLSQTLHGEREQVEPTFVSYVVDAYLRNSVVFACLAVRARLFSEARFQFQQLRNGRPGQLFGTPDLNVLEHPEPGKVTGDLLTRAILDADLGGNFFPLARPDRIRRLRPDWMTVVFGSTVDNGLGGWDPDAEVIGYGYRPGGPGSGQDIISFGPDRPRIRSTATSGTRCSPRACGRSWPIRPRSGTSSLSSGTPPRPTWSSSSRPP